MTRHAPVVFICSLSLVPNCFVVQILLTIMDSNPYLSDGSRQVGCAALAQLCRISQYLGVRRTDNAGSNCRDSRWSNPATSSS
jgi:hypothetical protein